MVASFPARIPQPRNMAIYWAATLDGRSQAELAIEHGISQQRVSQIVRSARLFVALATSEQYDGVPQAAQLQLGCRIQLKKLERRRCSVAAAWDASTRPKTSVKRVQNSRGERIETSEKSQHGDWRLDRQLGEIDKQTLDTTVLLYERPWVGREELRIADCGLRIREPRAARMRNAELGMRNDGGEPIRVVEVVEGASETGPGDVGLVEPGTEYSVLSTGTKPVEEETSVAVAKPESAPPADHSAFPIPNSALAGESAIAPTLVEPPSPKRPWRTEPLCDLTGRRILPPTDAHRPWRRVQVPLAWLLEQARGANTPQGVLLKPRVGLAESASQSSKEISANCDYILPWEEVERGLAEHLGAEALLAAP